MTTAQAVLLTCTIFLFIMGAWPIALITATIFITLFIINACKKDQNQNALLSEIEELKRENQKLRAELAEQAVRRAMDKAEKREKKD